MPYMKSTRTHVHKQILSLLQCKRNLLVGLHIRWKKKTCPRLPHCALKTEEASSCYVRCKLAHSKVGYISPILYMSYRHIHNYSIMAWTRVRPPLLPLLWRMVKYHHNHGEEKARWSRSLWVGHIRQLESGTKRQSTTSTYMLYISAIL